MLPDNVLFEDGVGKIVRHELMQKCNLHTILRLPKGIFTSAGVKTNVLFFDRRKKSNTEAIWFYDLRTNMPVFGKNTPLKPEHFAEFISSFGDDQNGESVREDQGDTGRFRRFTRNEIAERDENLDISWLRDESSDTDETLNTPEDIATAIFGHLQSALNEIQAVVDELAETVEVGE